MIHKKKTEIFDQLDTVNEIKLHAKHPIGHQNNGTSHQEHYKRFFINNTIYNIIDLSATKKEETTEKLGKTCMDTDQ